jgi:hypothetical protein
MGNPSLGYPPFRQLHGFDIKEKGDRPLLSKAKYVVEMIADFGGYASESALIEVSNMTTIQRDAVFTKGYQALIESVYPDVTIEVLDRRRIGDYQFQYVYDLLKNTFFHK